MQIDVAELANVDQLIDVTSWVQIDVLVDLVVVIGSVDAHLARHCGYGVLDVLQEVLGDHVDVAAAKCRCSVMVRFQCGVHAVNVV